MTERDLTDREREILGWVGGALQVLVHDVRNHLTKMMGQAQMLAWKLAAVEGVPPDTVRDVNERSTKIVDAVRECDALLGRYQRTYRRTACTPAAVPLRHVVETAISGLSEREVARVDSGEVGSASVRADPQVTPTALRECIRNGLTACSPDGHVRISTIVEADQARVLIADDGIGMTEEQTARAFAPFFCAWPESRGAGIGLWIAEHIVHECGGSIELVSPGPGAGTTAVIALPIAQQPPDGPDV